MYYTKIQKTNILYSFLKFIYVFFPLFPFHARWKAHKFGQGKIICSVDPVTEVKDSFCYLH